MLAFLKGLAEKLLQQHEPAVACACEDADRRDSARFSFGGRTVPARVGNTEGQMQIKNLSCGGVAAITELPVPLGGTVFVELPGLGSRAAEVRWTRNTTLGLKFLRPLEMGTVLRLFSSPFELSRRLAAGSRHPVAVPAPANDDRLPVDSAPVIC